MRKSNMKGAMLIETKKPRTRIEVRLTEKQKEKIDRAAKRCGITTSEYLRQRALGGEPKAVLPDAFFVCCETLDRLTRAPYAKDVNDAALAVLIEMKNILIGGCTALGEADTSAIEDPAGKQEPETNDDMAAEEKSNTVEPKPKFKLFGRR